MNVRRFDLVGVDERPDDADLADDLGDDLDFDVDGDLSGTTAAGKIEAVADLTDLDDLDLAVGARDDDRSEDASDDSEAPATDASKDADVRASGSASVTKSHPRISEAVRYLLDRYGMTSATEFPSAISVVSALRKEGVTTVSRSLAEVLSVDFGYTVCWVDVSWAEGAPQRQRGLRHRVSGLRRSDDGARLPGLLDVVGGEAQLDDVIRTSDETRVSYLHAGNTSTSLREVTRSVELHDLFDELSSKFEIVVFDSAPVADNSSALSLIQLAEAYVFVTHHGATTTQQVSEAVRLLEPVPSMGAVLNAYRSRTPRFIRRFFPAER